MVAMEGGEVTKKHAKFHKLDAEGMERWAEFKLILDSQRGSPRLI